MARHTYGYPGAALARAQFLFKKTHLADQMIAVGLDGGVKVDYARFADMLTKVR